MFRDSVKSTGYPLHSPVSPLLPLPTSPCAITFHLESTGFLSQEVQRSGHEADHSSPPNAEVGMNRSLPVLRPYALRARAVMTLAVISGH